jgi:hypothetical protein
MQFLLLDYDGTDSGALKRRLSVWQEHRAKIE